MTNILKQLLEAVEGDKTIVNELQIVTTPPPKPTPEEIVNAIKPILKNHFIKGKLSKTKNSVQVDFGVAFDNLSPAGKKRLEMASKNVGEKDRWSDSRFKMQKEIVADDKVEERYYKALNEMLAVFKKLGVSEFGYVKDTTGTSGFGGSGKKEFEMFPLKNVDITDQWLMYTIYKVNI